MLVAWKAAGQQGQVTTKQLRDCGLGPNAITVRARNGSLHRMYRGVYSVGHVATTREARFMAAVLACGDRADLSRFSVGMLLENLPREERLPDVTVVATKARRVEGIVVHRARSLHWRDVTHHEGIPMTSPERTLLDLAAVLEPRQLRSAARRAQAAHQVSVPQLRAVVDRSNGHPGAGALLAVIADGPVPTRSGLEDLVLDIVDAGGIERPECNVPLRFGGVTLIPDCIWRDRRVALEADSVRWHEHKLTREHDADKQAMLEANGWRVLRIDYQQARQRPEQTLARIRAALAT